MNLYFKNVSTDGSWNNVLNWFTDLACTVQASRVPWTPGDTTYLAYDLSRGAESIASGDNINNYTDIVAEVTGTCDIGYVSGVGGYLYNYANIYGGTFTGADFTNNSGYIYGGTFTGDYFTNSSGQIYGGTFTGANFTNNNYANIYGGTFTGADFTNSSGYISSGTFTGPDFYNNSGYINGGTFSGANFTNNSGYIYGGTFTGDYFTNSSGQIYGGLWLERGSMDVAVTTYNVEFGTTDITGFLRITGSGTNPVPYDIADAHTLATTYNGTAGFVTLNIPGQDVLGTGLI